MPNLEPKLAIRNALQAFTHRPLAQSALNLLETLGYQSDKRLALTPNNTAQFRAEFDPGQQLDLKNARTDEWRSVDFLFQISDDDMRGALSGQGQMFHNRQVDQTLINSYLFFAIELSGEHYTRGSLAGITRAVNKIFPMPVMLIFKHGGSLTLAIIARRMHKRAHERDVLEKVTLIKDMRLADPHRAHIEILHDLSLPQLAQAQAVTNFVELQRAWEKALDTSELNKKFYREVADWYFWASSAAKFPPQAESQMSVIRLITRLIFVWFIKEKGLVREELFDERRLRDILKASNPAEGVYYRAILQNLFFATLNTEMGAGRRFRGRNPNGLDAHHGIPTVYRYAEQFKDPPAALRLFAEIPFLNGGLFECLDKPDDKIYIDGFSDTPKNQAVLPDELFFGAERSLDLSAIYDDARRKHEKVRGIINIFNDYKFTVEENTPIEEEVALDPELLGKVFENLLAAYNPETGTTARKQTGSFYTPREIVNYMVDEALAAYLENAVTPTPLPASPLIQNPDAEGGGMTERLRGLLAYDNAAPQFSEDEVEQLIRAIHSLKALDPACGSGAFPMGLLHKLVFVLEKLDPENKRWREVQKHRAVAETEAAYEIGNVDERRQRLLDIDGAFENNASNYGRKLYLIENCIYGVDIQPIAVQIAKLRFFVSLVVEQKVDDSLPNRGIRPLPNLETKFVAANTLIGIERPAQLMLRNTLIDQKEKELAEARRKHFSARTPATKSKYRELDQQLREDLSGLLKKDGWGSAAAAQLAGWNPYDQNASAGFFDPEWMFGITTGFNVIIGNPPYLESRHPAFSENLKIAYQNSAKKRWNEDIKYITKGTDLLIYFFEHSIFNISRNGCIVFITQNSWLDTEYGRKFQKFLLRHTKVQKVVDSDFRYFPSGEGPNINAVITSFVGKTPSNDNIITFARYHENFQKIDLPNLSLSGVSDPKAVSIQRYKYSNNLLHETKWGILLSASNEILNLLDLISKKAKKLSEIKTANLSFGQGLNLSKDYYVSKDMLSELRIEKKATIPILTTDDGAVFDIRSTTHFILDKSRLSNQEITRIKSRGFSVFDTSATRKKPPKLIMPRGIGRHFCAISSISSYSSSGVDIYDESDSASDELLFNLWIFFNSSIAWLLREISGRKNLGGGMLKAEAIDLETLPVYMELRKPQEIKEIYEKM